MNKQKNNKNQQGMNQSQSGASSTGVATNVKQQSLSEKKQASKAEYGTLTAKDDANKDYE